MWHINQMQLAEQRQREMQAEAENWRLTHPKEEYQPNRTVRRNKRKRQ